MTKALFQFSIWEDVLGDSTVGITWGCTGRTMRLLAHVCMDQEADSTHKSGLGYKPQGMPLSDFFPPCWLYLTKVPWSTEALWSIVTMCWNTGVGDSHFTFMSLQLLWQEILELFIMWGLKGCSRQLELFG